MHMCECWRIIYGSLSGFGLSLLPLAKFHHLKIRTTTFGTSVNSYQLHLLVSVPTYINSWKYSHTHTPAVLNAYWCGGFYLLLSFIAKDVFLCSHTHIQTHSNSPKCMHSLAHLHPHKRTHTRLHARQQDMNNKHIRVVVAVVTVSRHTVDK